GDHSYCCVAQDHGLDKKVNYELIRQAEQSLENKKPIKINLKLKNINRTVGTLLSAEISKKYGEEGLRDNTIYINAIGSAGQSFAAFGAKGITFDLEGEANDYFGKGLTGSKLILRPFKESKFHAHDNVIVGNVAFYGATGGEAYIRGLAGERFCVRNSGVEVVVDSVGDHGCEYMTGGRVIILGEIGKNFAAGMSGGIAYVWDEKGVAKSRINQAMVGLEKIETDEEKIWLLNKIEKHVQYTSSIHSRSIVEKWKKEFPKFIKIMPEDYKRSMKQLTGNK
ncbi:MAG: glutamate synthase subunit alpha, partial [Gammaproteobacteria bacterium]|nr:glutamate synthase subunit alpha [Gammaproteobacteria bacterium]